MNRLYEKLELELVRFTAEDVITTSTESSGCPQEQSGCPQEQAGCPQEQNGCPNDCPDDCPETDCWEDCSIDCLEYCVDCPYDGLDDDEYHYEGAPDD